jgi:hypothetical protein
MKKFLMASSVAGLVGLAAMDVEDRDEAPEAAAVGWCSRRNLTLAPVTKQDM